MTLPAGTQLGPYQILSVLGAGGMGEVYRARDTRLGRYVAIKVVREGLSSDPDLFTRLEREAKIVARLSHPHICALHDVGCEGDVNYLVMECLEGQTLSARLLRGPLPIADALVISIQIAEALEHAHHAGVIHRDLKPSNVFLTRKGVKLLDFGLAMRQVFTQEPDAAADLATESTRLDKSMTDPGMIIGTLAYMAPEQLEGKEADARTDIFAFGTVLYEMVSGRQAFSGPSRVQLITAILRDEPRSLTAVAPFSPPELERLVRQCVAKDPENRWEAAHDLAIELGWIRDQVSSPGNPKALLGAPGRARHALTAGVALLLGLVAGFGTYHVLIKPGMPPRASSQPPRQTPTAPVLQGGPGHAQVGQAATLANPLVASPIAPTSTPTPGQRLRVAESLPREKPTPQPTMPDGWGLYEAAKRHLTLKECSGAKEQAAEVIALNPPTDLARLARLILLDAIDCEAGITFIHIPGTVAGFQMGCTTGDPDCYESERPSHVVSLKEFLIAETETTSHQYGRCVVAGGCRSPGKLPEPALPVANVSWEDATSFCKWAAARLPTEAEWEYAARGGLSGLRYPWGNSIDHDKANYEGVEGKDRYEQTAPARSFEPNAFGLFDVAGNVWEWCHDRYGKDYYRNSSAVDPQGPESGSERVMRGGAWTQDPRELRTSVRRGSPPDFASGVVGFRCARDVLR